MGWRMKQIWFEFDPERSLAYQEFDYFIWVDEVEAEELEAAEDVFEDDQIDEEEDGWATEEEATTTTETTKTTEPATESTETDSNSTETTEEPAAETSSESDADTTSESTVNRRRKNRSRLASTEMKFGTLEELLGVAF